MYVDRNTLQEYPYHGVFYIPIDDLPEDGGLLNDNGSQKEVILETICDIQETNKQFSSGVITSGYTIFFPTPTREKEDGSAEEYINDKLKPGIRFRATMYNLAVEGMVTGVYPTQMHGCTAYIKGTDV